MEKLRTYIIFSLLSLLPSMAEAQKVKMDQEAAAIIAENSAAAVLVESFRSQKIDSVKSYKEKVAAAMTQVNVLKESWKRAHLNTKFFEFETRYYKNMLKHGLSIIQNIPKFIATATSISPQATVKAIKVSTQISEEISSIIDIYNNVVLNKTNYMNLNLPTHELVDDGNQPNQPGVPNQPGSNPSDPTGNDNSNTDPSTPTDPSNPYFPDVNIITDGDIGDIIPGSGNHQTPDDDINTTPRINPDDNSSSPNGTGFRRVPTARRIGEVPGQNVSDSTYVGVTDGDGLDPIGGQVEHIDTPETEYTKGDGFNWLDRSERLSLAINLETRLSKIDYKIEMFIKTARFYKPTDIVMMLDYHTWSRYIGSRYAVEDIINKINNFNLNF